MAGKIHQPGLGSKDCFAGARQPVLVRINQLLKLIGAALTQHVLPMSRITKRQSKETSSAC